MCVSLIVLQCVSAVKYLGPAPLARSALSPSFLPFRTALDVLRPGPNYSTYPWAALAPRYQPAYHPLASPFIPFQPQFIRAPQNALVVSSPE